MPATQVFDASPVAGASGKWAKLAITNAQTIKWSEIKTAMLWAVPSFSDIWMAMMVDKDGDLAWFTDEIETCATDDKYLYINPKFYFALTLDEHLFINSHEIEHAMYGHAGMMFTLGKQGHIVYSDGVTLPFNHELLNIAQDYVINDQLVRAKIGKMPKGGLHWPSTINGDMNVLDAYRLLYKANGKKPKPQPHVMRSTDESGNDKGDGAGKSFDKLIEPGKATGKGVNKAMSERSQSEWDTTIQAAMESAKARGQLPANLERLFSKRLQPKADWRDLYMLAVSKKIGNDRYTWDRLEQQLAYRKIGAPGRTSYGCNLVVIACDTSGSITQRTLDVFLAETAQLLEQAKPRRIIFTQCDMVIHEWREIQGTDDLDGKLKGGGGTMFEPVFEKVTSEGEEPDLLIYLTDLMGSFPSVKPSYPIIWGCVDERYAKDYPPPWGDVVMVPPQHEEA